MRIVITGGRSPLGKALTHALADKHDVATLDLPNAPGDSALTFVGDVRDRDFAQQVAGDCDAIIHLLPLDADEDAAEILELAARGTYNLVRKTSATRFILLSSLRMFEQYPAEFNVNEYWSPRPTTDVADLAPYLAEVTLREASRVLPIRALALRLGEVAGLDGSADDVPDTRAVHYTDVVHAVERALAFEPQASEPRTGWWVFHIVGAGAHTRFPLGMAAQDGFGYQPQHDLTHGASPSAPRARSSVRLSDRQGGTARRVVVFGAGGPLAAATSDALAHDHVLRLTDRRPLAEITGPDPAQHPDAPFGRALGAPHETRTVDISDAEQVREAAEGMDAIINCTVLRNDPVGAFRVNMLGAYHVMCAAVACGIRRVVHTGPFQLGLHYPAGYWYDYGLGDDVPARPGTELYILTKLLGQEICRIFAEEYDLEVPTLLFCGFVNPATTTTDPLGLFPFSVSWEDAATAMRLALHAPSFPHPFEIMHIQADLPHGKYTNEKAKRLLNWQPRDRLAKFYYRPTTNDERPTPTADD